jgi:hypothetical protein
MAGAHFVRAQEATTASNPSFANYFTRSLLDMKSVLEDEHH